MLLYYAAWAVIGLGILRAGPSVIRLTVGRAEPQMTASGARRAAWSDLGHSLSIVVSGVTLLLAIGEWRTGSLWRLASVPVFAVTGWDLVSWLKSGRSGKPDGGIGEGASGPAAIERSEPGYPRALPLPAQGASAGELAEWVDGKIFSTTRLRPGYDEEEVDDFLDAIRDTFLGVRATSLTSNDVRNIHFSTTRVRPGYDEQDVDAFLDQVVTRLAT